MNIPTLTVPSGEVGLCQIIKDKNSGELKIDLGFKVHLDYSYLNEQKVKEGQIFNCPKERAGAFNVVSATAEKLFTYCAKLTHVVDGDTLVVEMTLGLGIFTELRLRLRGIDCPELDNPEGKRARAFVVRELRNCPMLVIKTTKDRTDKYARYLADVFALPKESNPQTILESGKFLNQELLNAGHAVVV